MRFTRWRHSLYARALLLTAIGGGSLVGAIAVQSHIMVSTSVERLLKDRLDLARITGAYLEHVLEDGLERAARPTQFLLNHPENSDFVAALTRRLESVQPTSLFGEGLFVLDPRGRIITAVPRPLIQTYQEIDLVALVGFATQEKRIVVSPLMSLPAGPKILIALTPMLDPAQKLVGFVGGVLNPAAANLLDWSKSRLGNPTTALQMVDENGITVAATRADQLLTLVDHGQA